LAEAGIEKDERADGKPEYGGLREKAEGGRLKAEG
jgi:hypothetical protein